MKSRDELICSNLGLVHSCAKRFKNRGVEYEELYSAGCVGLIKAIDNFDESRGFKISTYAVPVILGEIRRLFREGTALKVSRSIKELWMKTSAASKKFTEENGREPHISELAEILNVSEGAVTEAMCACRYPLSLTPSGDDDKGENDIPVNPPEEQVTELLSLKQALDRLETDDKKLISLRYYKNKTQTETADALNMTQVQVSRREKKILIKIRQELLA